MRTIHDRISRSLLLCIPCLLLASSPVAAQTGDDPPPSTLTLDRMDSASRFGMQIGFDKIDRVKLSDGFVMRFEPYGQYILPNQPIGVYAQLPIAHVFDFTGSDATGMGNLEAGAFFLPLHDATLILRTGLAVGTGSDMRDKGLVANALSAYERMTDFVQIAPEYTTLRLSGSTLQQSGIAFFRADLGLDIAVDKPSGTNGTFVHLNIAGGVRASMLDLSAELVTVGTLDGDGDTSDNFIHTLAFAFRTRGADQIYGGMVFPLDENLRGEIWIFSLGYQHVAY
jgi:hypothetical protein